MSLSAVGLQTHIWNNNLKSILLLLGYPFLLLLLMWLFFFGMAVSTPAPATSPIDAGFEGIILYWHIVLGITTVWFLIAWMFHQNMINAATGARPLTRAESPRIYNLLENLCISRGITMPTLYVIESEALNAFASGLSQKSYAITVTTALMQRLNDAELEAVLGHELTHIINRDVRLLIIGVIFAGMISFFAECAWRSLGRSSMRGGNNRKNGQAVLIGALVLAIGYFFAIAIRMALSRKREFLADAGSVELTRNPDAMVSALQKIAGHARIENVPGEVEQMFIENPPGVFSMFATHPPIESRIAALQRFAGAQVVLQQVPTDSGPWQT